MALLFALSGPGAARADTEVTVPTAKESWYFTTPVEAPPGSPAVSPYPAGTLHVGVTGGQEESRSYITLDLGSVSSQDDITGGTLVLPVAPDAGTHSPESAAVRICRAADPGDDVEGSTAPPPAADCSLSADAEYDEERNVFEADLDQFLGFLDGGLAIVPRTPAEGSWHVAFYGRDTDAEGAEPITARLAIDDAGSSFEPPPFFDSGSFAADVHPESSFQQPAPEPLLGGPVAPAPGSAPPPMADVAPSADLEPAEGEELGRPILFGRSTGFKYSVIFLLPLLLLVAVPYFGHALTTPVRGAAPGGTRRR